MAGAVVVAAGWPGGSGGAWTPPPAVKSRIYTVDLAANAGGTSVDLPERATPAFSMLGITWTDPTATPHGPVQVRTRSAATGAWSPWRTLDSDERRGPDARAESARAIRGGTDPLWVGPADGVAARIAGATGGAAGRLPAGLRLDLIDSTGGAVAPTRTGGTGGRGGGQVLLEPSGDPTPTATAPDPTTAPASTEATTDPATAPATGPTGSAPAPTDTTSPASPPATTPASSAPSTSPTSAPPPPLGQLPPYVSRAQWQADESLVTDPPQYGTDAKVLFVHHTAGTNTYSCADSPAIVRGILAYHVTSQGWNDIGYNFLVDKCGTLFEGRKGGVDKPVIGAHTYGFNTNSAGIAVLGTYITDQVPAATAATVAKVAAYKLGLAGHEPSTRAELTEGVADGKFPKGTVVSFNRVSGHRDGVATECPGDALYAQLAGIRTQATMIFYGFAGRPVSGGVSSGGTYYVRGTATLNWTIGAPAGQVARFELVVDGRTVGSVPATTTSAPVTLADGAHRVAVRAVYATGTTTIAPAAAVVSDATAPVFSKPPELAFRGGTVSTTSAPVTLTWRATDAIKLTSVALTTPTTATFGPATTAWATSATVGVSRTWRMTARDAAGNSRYASATRTPTLISETAATRSGTWSTKSSTSYLGGTSLTSATRGSKLTWTFIGRAVGLIVSRGSASGQVDVYVDGTWLQTVDLRSSTTLYRQLIWQRSFAGSTRHTVAIVVKGTSGRPGVTVDGLIALA